jgi:AcrR family transcriptional regulator
MSGTAIAYHRGMSRWEPDARGRLEKAALELYRERGFERTTVAEIAQRAGVTERTFFRHFADKREVLFGRTGEFQDLFVRAAAEVPDRAAPLDVMSAALDAVAEFFEGRRFHARQRQAVITANTELRERELIKLAALAAALADTLRLRGVSSPAADLAAETAVAVFRVSFERWLTDPEERPLSALARETLTTLRSLAAPAG